MMPDRGPPNSSTRTAASSPIDDVRASADSRRAMAAVVTRRAIAGALARARGETVTIPASSTLFGVD